MLVGADHHPVAAADQAGGRDRELARVVGVGDDHRAGRRGHLGQRLPVVPVPVGGHDRAHRGVADEFQQPVRLVGRVDQHQRPGLGAAQQVGVVVHRPDRHLGHGQAGKLTGVGRAADGHVPGVCHGLSFVLVCSGLSSPILPRNWTRRRPAAYRHGGSTGRTAPSAGDPQPAAVVPADQPGQQGGGRPVHQLTGGRRPPAGPIRTAREAEPSGWSRQRRRVVPARERLGDPGQLRRHELARASRRAGNRRPGPRGGSPPPTAASPARDGRGSGGPFSAWTWAAQASPGRLAASAANAMAVACTSAARSAAERPAPASMSARRASRLAYMGVSVPVRAQRSRLPRPSPLRAMWVSTCPRVQPGSSDGSPALASVSAAAEASRRSVASPMRAIDRRTSFHALLPFRPAGPSRLPYPGQSSRTAWQAGEGTRWIPGRRQGRESSDPVFVSTPGYHDVSIVG